MKSEGEVSAIHPAPKVVKMAKSHFYFAGLLAPLMKALLKDVWRPAAKEEQDWFVMNLGN